MPTDRINLDFETRSACDIKECGAYRYAEDPSTEVLIIAVSHNGGPVKTWDIRQGLDRPNSALSMLREAIEKRWEIHAFNSQFEFAILKYVCTRQFTFPAPDVNQMRCTAAVCRAAGLPPSLKRAAEFLKLPIQKDKMGVPLIHRFSIPNKDGSFTDIRDTSTTFTVGGERHTAASAFQKFVDYCVRDVETEMIVAEAMKDFALTGHQLESFLLDARINDRGVPVDATALLKARDLGLQYAEELTKEFHKLTGLSPTQNKKCNEWLKEHGYRGSGIAKDQREKWGNDPNLKPKAKRALRILAELSYQAVKKIPSMLECMMEDHRIRGSFLWCGAQKTGRWSCQKPQWQNMKKPIKTLAREIEVVYQEIRSGTNLGVVEGFYGNPYLVLACLARYFVRFKDVDIYDADFSSVEARILPQLIGCQRILDTFGTEGDLYSNTAKRVGEMFGEVIDRQQGKTLILATQFGGGANAVFTATGKTWPLAKCKKVVKLIREENPEFPTAWRQFAEAFEKALDNPGKWFDAGKYVQFGFTRKKPFPRMYMKLPSGRKITYPYPEKIPMTMVRSDPNQKGEELGLDEKWESLSGHLEESQILKDMQYGDSFINPNYQYGSHFHTYELTFYGHVKGVNYGRVKTYGGDLLQSATQATGLDLLVNGVLAAEREGFEPFLVVHDQCLVPARGDKDVFVKALCEVPDWFKGFPLEAEADQVRSYCKS